MEGKISLVHITKCLAASFEKQEKLQCPLIKTHDFFPFQIILNKVMCHVHAFIYFSYLVKDTVLGLDA